MQIICISRGSQSRGEEFAEKLAAKLGYECISREQLIEEAIRQKIPIGKLETAIIKPHIFSEELALELEHYKALVTSILCEKALKHSIVYHGRTGHLLLQGVEHVFKIRVESDMTYRIPYVMKQLNISEKKARRYIEQIEEDRRKWVRQFYHIEWDVFTLYDLVLNLTHMNVDNAATAVCQMAQLPEFQATPASISKLKDLYLASRARLLLATHPKSRHKHIQVKATNGVVHLTYLSQEVRECSMLNELLKGLEDAREIICTKAESTILWIQESFDIDDDTYKKVLSLARTWNAAIELIKVVPCEDETLTGENQTREPENTNSNWQDEHNTDDEESDAQFPKDITRLYEKLILDGKAGGERVAPCTLKSLLNTIDRSSNYRLIILDKIFITKSEAIQKRLCQEWSNVLSDSLKVPVITLEELISKYHFGPRQAVRLTVFALLTAVIVFLLFHYEDIILSFLAKDGTSWRILEAIAIALFVPLFASLYGTVTGLFLKLIKLD